MDSDSLKDAGNLHDSVTTCSPCFLPQQIVRCSSPVEDCVVFARAPFAAQAAVGVQPNRTETPNSWAFKTSEFNGQAEGASDVFTFRCRQFQHVSVVAR